MIFKAFCLIMFMFLAQNVKNNGISDHFVLIY